jgi:HK97 gp10 family phage protein
MARDTRHSKFKSGMTGGPELIAALKAIGDPKGIKRMVASAQKKALKPVVEAAKQNAPVGDSRGMRDSIKARHVSAREARRLGAAVIKPTAVGPDREHFYAQFLEFGTSKYAARPFLRPAWDSTKDQVLADFSGLLWKAIDRRAKRVAKKASV